MFSNNRKTIGVFSENTSNELQYKVCDGIIREAAARGYNVALFSSQGSYGQSPRFGVGDMQIFQLPPYEELAGAVLLLDTMDNRDHRKKLVDTIKSRCTCPIVSIRMVVPGVHNILADNSTCMDGVIRHFIEHHKMKKLCFMSGPEIHADAIGRLNGFKSIMAEYGLPVGEHQIFHGDFWKYSGAAACDWFLNGQEKPDAIICANDYMAIALSSELIARGYRIPDDICVSGYDGIESALAFSPSITSAEAPFTEMGKESVAIIDQQQQEKTEPQTIYLKSKLHLRESCGCLKGHDIELMTIRRNQYENLEQSRHRGIVFSYMSTQLAEYQTMEGVSDVLTNYLDNFPHLRSYAVCLNQNMSSDHKLSRYTEDMDVRIAFKDGQVIPRANVPFQKKDLVPSLFTDAEPQAWYFVPLHFLDYCLGYEAFRFDDKQPAGTWYFQFDAILCNKIYETLTYAKMEQMIQELKQSSLHDALTGLYNRGAFNQFGGQLFKTCRDAGKPVFVAVLDMDNLKLINDAHGHIEGDFALKRIAAAISHCCSDQYIFARTGGDEFYVIGQNVSEEAGAKCMAEIEEELVNFYATGKKNYAIHVSSGYYMAIPDPGDQMDDFIKVADSFMYHNKIENKKRRGESLR